MVGAHAHPAGVGADVVDLVGVDLAQDGVFEVVHAHRFGLALGPPFPAAVLEVLHQFLLLGVHTDHRIPSRAELVHPFVEVGELRVPVGVLATLDGFGVGLQAETLRAEQFRDGLLTHRVPGLAQQRGELAGGQRRPRQQRLRVPAPGRLDQAQQRRHQTRVGLHGRFAATPGTAHPAQRGLPRLQFRDPVTDPRPRRTRGPRHRRHPTMTQRPGLPCQHQPLAPLVQMRQHRLELDPHRLHHIIGNGHTSF